MHIAFQRTPFPAASRAHAFPCPACCAAIPARAIIFAAQSVAHIISLILSFRTFLDHEAEQLFLGSSTYRLKANKKTENTS